MIQLKTGFEVSWEAVSVIEACFLVSNFGYEIDGDRKCLIKKVK